jgi:hydrogenase maturation protease
VGLVAASRLRATLPSPIDITTDTAGGTRLVDLCQGVHTLILLDALAVTPSWPLGAHIRWRYPNDRDQLQTAGLRGTHSFSVVQGLELAEALDRLPHLVLIHALAVSNFELGSPLSDELTQPLKQWIQLVREDALMQLAQV